MIAIIFYIHCQQIMPIWTALATPELKSVKIKQTEELFQLRECELGGSD